MIRLFIDAAAALWRDSRTPEIGSTPNRRAALAAGHILIGALAATVLPLAPWLTAVVVAAIYVLLKEARDVRKGGSVWDSVTDTAFVAVGALYTGPWAWPWLAAATMATDQIVHHWRQARR